MSTCRECGKVLSVFGSDGDALCELCAMVQDAEVLFRQIRSLEDDGKTRAEITEAVWDRWTAEERAAGSDDRARKALTDTDPPDARPRRWPRLSLR
ncbi:MULTISPECIES: hypothetical protein [Rhodovulum]|uniref:Uncharacterized protein n=2 Tax=Rhodovulum TaxID=34008 RepID=A0A8E2VPA2_9RHOB|nr:MULTISPECIES: hypothetical protein [Rhodovulum]PTW51952.1 hypothetical protein C8N38_101256 [Rhodovulum kholense]RAP40167.1 hypothetical protein BYZ73_16650 [Rhodovulum viride]